MTTKSTAGAFVIEREIRIDAPRERVFQLVASHDEMRRWFRPAVFEPKVGGRAEFVFPFDDEDAISRGEITAYDPPSRVAYTWAWQSAPPGTHTEVTIDLIDEGATTLVRLTHTGFVDEKQVRGHDDGWGYWLGRLQTVGGGGDPGPDNHVAAEKRREAVKALRSEELALKDHVERVAAQRRALPVPAPLDEDYALTETDDKVVRLSELFGNHRDLIVYHLMFKPEDDEACPMCSMWVDGFNAVARHVRERAAFVVIAKAPIGKLREWAKRRGWDNIRVLSSYSTTFNHDLHAEDADGDQAPTVSVFRKSGDGVHHFYQGFAMFDDDNSRGIDLLSPVWNLFDLLPDGRGDWYPSNRPAM
jgi:predicted dithiol-disulfide oxidoreductase (DUF899 family)/uncharacterized protein YndB with AHSA1/START domain